MLPIIILNERKRGRYLHVYYGGILSMGSPSMLAMMGRCDPEWMAHI